MSSIQKTSVRRAGWLMLGLGLLCGAAAQPVTPHIGYVYPAGGARGGSCEVIVGGQYLATVSSAYISGAGVQAAIVEYNRPMSQKQFMDLRDKLRELQGQRAAAMRRRRSGAPNAGVTNRWTPSDENMLVEIRNKILKNPPNRQANPAIVETVTLKVTIATNAPPGDREIRLSTASGLSNPMLFCIGSLPEFSKPRAKVPSPEAERLRERLGGAALTTPSKSEMRIRPPCIVNGQILPGAVDRFRFAARQGQQLLVAASARELIPYLADAVPGWFQATLALYSARGKELAYADDFRFHPDPVLCYNIPADGDYVLEIKDAIYRGREDFVYRIRIGELPFITSVFPLGGPAGAETAVELKGWNLPVTNLTVDAKGRMPGTLSISAGASEQPANRVPFVIGELPEAHEREPNSQAADAQDLRWPIVVNGRIDRPGDLDVFRFEGKAGDEIVAEVTARRVNSPLDPVLRLIDRDGTQIAFNDDHEDKGAGLMTHHADSYLRTLLPANGTYCIHLADAQRQGGPEYAYRLRLSASKPDFELRVVPSSLSGRAGACVAITVYALRKDGFSNEIALALIEAPNGFALSGARLPANSDQVRLTVTLPASPREQPIRLRLQGRANVARGEIVHEAVPADDMMQAFAYHHLVPAQELNVAVSGRFTARPFARVTGESPVAIPAGGTGRVQIASSALRLAGPVHFELNDPPEGVSLKTVSPGRDGMELVLASDASKTRPGLQGNLIVNAFSDRPTVAGRPAAQAFRRRTPLGVLPAIPFQVVAAR